MAPSLWFSHSDITAIRGLLDSGDPVARHFLGQTRRIADRPVSEFAGGDEERAWNSHVTTQGDAFLVSCGLMYLLSDDPTYCRKAFTFVRYWTSRWITADVTLGHWAMHIAAAYDCCAHGWTETERATVAGILRDIVDTTLDIQRLSPHVVANNHWAISFGGAAVAAMAIDGAVAGEPPMRIDMAGTLELCLGRIRAFLAQVGDHGAFHEGASYLLYSFTTVLPAIIAARRKGIADIAAEFPCLQRVAALMYAMVAPRPVRTDSDRIRDTRGMMLSWNNCPLTWDQSHVGLLLIHFAPDSQRGALKQLYATLRGLDSDQPAHMGSLEPLFGLSYYPFDTCPRDPDTVLPHCLTDMRHGLTIFRKEYRDARDTIAGIYCRTTCPAGGNSHDDAGSVRFMAKGHDWIMGGGQLRGAARYQSIVTPRGEGDRPKPHGFGALLWNQATPRGGIAAVDIRNASGAYHERYLAIDWSGHHGTAATLALLDIIDDHKGRPWDWNMTFEPGLDLALDPDGAGFSLVSDDRWELGVRFVGAPPCSIEPREVPAVTRRFTSGFSREIECRPFVTASFETRPVTAIFAVLTLTRENERPAVTPCGSTDIMIGSSPWARPFGAATPRRFDPHEPCGILSKYPAGTRELLCARYTPEQRVRLEGSRE